MNITDDKKDGGALLRHGQFFSDGQSNNITCQRDPAAKSSCLKVDSG
jgi:hypothetical protein